MKLTFEIRINKTLTGALKINLLLIVLFSMSVATADAQTSKPNILFIMADDVGWSNPSCYHQGLMSSRTPNIDRIAKEGMRFTDNRIKQ